MACSRAGGCILAIAVLWAAFSLSMPACSLVGGLNQLQKVACLDECDGGLEAAQPSDASNGAADANTNPNADAGGADAGGASAYRAAVLADSPIGYWRLGDAPGSATCHDESGHGHDGTLMAGVTLGVAGALTNDPDTAAQFDGTGTIDVGGSFLFAGNTAFSWEVWIKPSVLDGNFRPFFSSMTFDNNGDPVSGTYMVSYSDTGDTFGFERYNASAAVIALDTSGLKVNQWTYIAATSDGVVYMNGNSILTGKNVGSVPTYTADTLFGSLLKGDLDEIAIYDHVLTATAVTNHWNASGR